MFTINVAVNADIHIHNVPDADTTATLKRIEDAIDAITELLVPGPAVDLHLKSGTPTEHP
jgi:hypothetical protein